jgi:hypothetical protein
MSDTNEESPMINKIKWGSIEVHGFDKCFKDIIIYPGGLFYSEDYL